MRYKKGTTRLVFVFNKFVIKIPNFTYSQQNFLTGCLANHNERWFSKEFRNLPQSKLIARTWLAIPFGLLVIQERVKELDRATFDMNKDNLKEKFKDVCKDFKKENLGINKHNNIVALDYG